ncbi:hypothetical protein ACLSU7_14700 [Bdellovibrio sp. HCB185ZH]|uniref:hypothetical protein n=1 Tax=Bdellovibrio sp. HCB185ZH TaxID=3394235 RepID=UPI0039A53097
MKNSVQLAECPELYQQTGALVANMAETGQGDCNEVMFKLYSPGGVIKTGRLILNTENKYRRIMGIVKKESLIPKFDFIYRESSDEKTKKPIYMGLHPLKELTSEEEDSVEKFFSLQLDKPTGAPKMHITSRKQGGTR